MRIGFIEQDGSALHSATFVRKRAFRLRLLFKNTGSAEESAEFIGGSCPAYTGLKEIITDSDLIFITVNDGAIADVSHNIASECRKMGY